MKPPLLIILLLSAITYVILDTVMELDKVHKGCEEMICVS